MIPLWVLATFFAAFMQTIRTAVQKALKTHLSADAITWARFGFGIPWVVVLVFALMAFGQDFPRLNLSFLFSCFLGGVAQIIGTICLVELFSYRNFMIGTTYSKTESFQAAILGAMFFGVYLGLGVMIAILIGIVGVIMISTGEQHIKWVDLFRNFTKKSSLMGLGSGAGFALASLYIREAGLALPTQHTTLMIALTTLLSTVFMQTILLGFWIFFKNRTVFSDIFVHWKSSALVGLTGILGSIGWFIALVLTEAAYVKTVGQVELIFSFLVTHFIFKEKINRLEIFGTILIVGSIILMLVAVE